MVALLNPVCVFLSDILVFVISSCKFWSFRELMTSARSYCCGVSFEPLFALKFDHLAVSISILGHQLNGYKACFGDQFSQFKQ